MSDMFRYLLPRYGPVFTVPMMGKNITFLVGPEEQAPFFKLNVRREQEHLLLAHLIGFSSVPPCHG